MGIGKRLPYTRKYGYGKQKNTANSGDMKGSRLYANATASQVRKLVGDIVKDVRLGAEGKSTEIIYTATGAHRWTMFDRLREAGIEINYGEKR